MGIKQSENHSEDDTNELLFLDEKGQTVSHQCPDFAFKMREREHHPRIAFRSSDSSDSEAPEEYDNHTKDPFQKVVEAACRPLTFNTYNPV